MVKLGTLIAAGLVALCIVGTASAASSQAATSPPGYSRSVVQFMVPAHSYVYPGTVACGAGTVVWGGGAGDLLPTFGESLVTSSPSGTSWFAQYDNASTSTATASVDAICAKKPSKYKQVAKGFDNPINAQTTATAKCPTGTVVLSGGLQSTADSFGSALLSLGPVSKTTFRAINFNGTGADEHLTVWAICAKQPPKYAIVAAPISGTSHEFATQATCPAKTSVVGGGVIQSDPKNTVVLTASIDVQRAWDARVLNPNSESTSLVTKVICAA